MEDSQYVKFVSQKIRKVRWRPMHSTLQKPDVFITGSWDDVQNSLNIWTLQGEKDLMSEDVDFEQLKCVERHAVPGDVGDIRFADPDTLTVALSNGDVLLLSYNSSSQRLNLLQNWVKIHHNSGLNAPCTGVDVSGPDIVTVGEDGTINFLRMGSDRPVRNMVQVDSSPITAARFLKSSEVATVNKMGQLRVYDTRSSKEEPSRIIASSEDLIALESVDRHPTRPHILAAGGADGCVTTFDVRKDSAPITKLAVHSMEVWELQFHPTSPDHLFTCAEDGAIRKLDVTSELKNQDSFSTGNRPPVDVIELLNCHGIAVNSVNVSGSRLVCGTDSESIYILENIL